ncbi:hypothetical protein [Streptomyces sp. NBC_00557]|uniref:hypothetical protein n=1 Tax=Streptomyces sp. NBC_00557 TaxID=2975776 RepID=UPI002E81558C|nr:hypothetical protein [Streptomyces sp. NBC_00557]WUC36349.1 hypothetical protein OG956_20070 [Streptomyces sp. NBC_00557]
MNETLPHRLHGRVQDAAALLALPLDARQIEALALELTGPVRALIAEAVAAAGEDAPVAYMPAPTVAVDEQTGVTTTEYAGCTTRIADDVDYDSPAAALAAQLRRHHDVRATDIPTGSYLGLTIRPRTLAAWQWWLAKLGISDDAVTVQGTHAYAVGALDGVAVHLCGEDTAALFPDGAMRPGLDVDFDTPAGNARALVLRQPDVTSAVIVDALTLEVTVRATSLMEWGWWLHQLNIDPARVEITGDIATATGSKDGAVVKLRGEGVPDLLTDRAAARLAGLIAPATT